MNNNSPSKKNRDFSVDISRNTNKISYPLESQISFLKNQENNQQNKYYTPTLQTNNQPQFNQLDGFN